MNSAINRTGHDFFTSVQALKSPTPVLVPAFEHQAKVFSSAFSVLTDAISGFVLRNNTDHPITSWIEHVPSGDDAVPISFVLQAVGGTNTMNALAQNIAAANRQSKVR